LIIFVNVISNSQTMSVALSFRSGTTAIKP
jgi:hypothetical protein